MKNSLFSPLLLFATACFCLSVTVFAQPASADPGLTDRIAPFPPPNYKAYPLHHHLENNPDDVNKKAISDFTSRFKGIHDERWYTLSSGYVVYFNDGNDINRIFYDKKGNWLSSWKIYQEIKMPRGIRTIVKTNYYDYRITLVDEIEFPQKLAYIVHLEDELSYKLVKVSADGDMEELEIMEKVH